MDDLIEENYFSGAFVAGSQSVHDVNEGFDYQVRETGHYVLVAGWQPGLGCNSAYFEKYGWAIWRIEP